MNCNNFGDIQTFVLVPSTGQNVNLSNILFCFEIYKSIDMPIRLLMGYTKMVNVVNILIIIKLIYNDIIPAKCQHPTTVTVNMLV